MTGPTARPLKASAGPRNGQALLEFALFAYLLVAIMVGVADLSFYLITAMALQEAATEGAAYGASAGNQNDNSGMVMWANQAAAGVTFTSGPTSTTFYTCSPGGAHVASSVSCTGNAAPMEYVSVSATASLSPFFTAAFLATGPLTSTAVYRVAWKTQ